MRLHALQYLRAVAAFAVVYHHTASQIPGYLGTLPSGGAYGVDIFFVISGFIMVWIAREDDTPRRFLAARVRRVVPLYWFFTLLMAALLLVAPRLFDNQTLELRTLLGSLFFWPHESSAHPGQLWPIVAPGWSLNYEMYFYLLFALSMLVALRWRVLAVSTLLCAAFLIGALHMGGVDMGVGESPGGTTGALASFVSETVVFEFVIGMLLAVAYRRGQARGATLSSRTALCLLLLGVALLLLDLPFVHILRYGLPAGLIVAACLYLKLPQWRFGELLGDASYALYLSHIFVLGGVRFVAAPGLQRLLGDGALYAWTYVAVAVVACTLAAILTHLLIDNWLLRRERLQAFGIGKTSTA